MASKYLTIAETAEEVGVAERTLRDWIDNPHRMPDDFPECHVISQRVRRFLRKEVAAWKRGRKRRR